MLSPHDALLLASRLATIRSHCALVELRARYDRPADVQKVGFAAAAAALGRKIERGKTAEDLDVLAALASLAQLLPGDDALLARVLSRKSADTFLEAGGPLKVLAQLQRDMTQTATTMVHPGGIAERALGLGLGLGDVLVAGRTANYLGRVLALDGAAGGVEAELAQALEVLASARESAAAAIARFASSLTHEEVSPATREPTTVLADRVRAEPPRFDAKEAAPGLTWCRQLDRAMRDLIGALSYPAEPPVLLPESPEERALLEEILRHPDEDAPRLQWAALAAARHDLRAEIVRTQLATRAGLRARPTSPGPEVALTGFLLRTHPEWLDEVRRLGAESAVFHGGFVEEITIAASTYLENAAALLQTTPLRRLRLTGVAPHLDALLASGTLDRIVWLDLASQELDDTHVAKLAAAPGLAALRALCLDQNRISDAGVRALWASPTLAPLVYCGLDGNPCTAVAAWELTPVEMSQYEWVFSEFGAALERSLGRRRWAPPWASVWPPSLDAVVAFDRWAPLPPATTPQPSVDHAARPASPLASEKICAACGARAVLSDAKRPVPPLAQGECGLDGRPSYDVVLTPEQRRLAIDAEWLEAELALEQCPRCGHLAPDVAFAYPQLADAAEARAGLLALEGHAPGALPYLAIAHLYGDADPRAQGTWVLRAAWADEAAGFVAMARGLRRRAGALLEDALFQGYALATVRGVSSRILAEIFRVAGDAARAREHIARGAASKGHREGLFLQLEAACLADGVTDPFTMSGAMSATLTRTTDMEEMYRLMHALKAPPPLRLRKLREVDPGREPTRLEEARVFAQDFLDPELLVELLRDGRGGVWDGLVANREVLPAVLRATLHEEATVRNGAEALLAANTLFQKGPAGDWRDEPRAMAPLLERVLGSKVTSVREVGASLCELLCLPAAHATAMVEGLGPALLSGIADPEERAAARRLLAMAPPPARPYLPPPSRPAPAPAPAPPPPPSPAPSAAGSPGEPAPGDATRTDLEGVLRELLRAVNESPVRAVDLRDRLAARANAVTTSGKERSHPKWASSPYDDKDIYVELGGDVVGVHLYDDSRGWGARAELRVARGTREDLERVTGPTEPLPAQPFRPAAVGATVNLAWGDVRMFADHTAGKVASVQLQYPSKPHSVAVAVTAPVAPSGVPTKAARLDDAGPGAFDGRILQSLERWHERARAQAQVAVAGPPVDGSTAARTLADPRELTLEALVGQKPSAAEAKQELFRLRMERRAFDAAWCVASVRAEQYQLAGIEQLFYEAHKPKRVTGLAGSIEGIEGELGSLLAHPDGNVHLDAFFAAIAPAFYRVRSHDRGPAREDDPRFLPPALRSPMFRPAFARAIQALALPPQTHFADVADPAASYAAIPPTADLARGYDGFTLSELLFVAGRQAAFHRPWHLVLFSSRSQGGLKLLLLAGLTLIGTDAPVPPDLAASVAAVAKALGSELTPAERQEVTLALRRVVSESPKLDFLRWMRAQELTSARAGLLLSGDLGVARKMLEAEPKVDGDLSVGDKLKDLAGFATSGAYAALRERLGVGIQAVPAPIPSRWAAEEYLARGGHEPTQALTWIEAHPTEELLAIAGEDGSVWLWNSDTGGIVKRLRHGGRVANARWSPDGRLLAVAESRGRVTLYDRAGEVLRAFDTGHGTLRHVAFHPSSQRLATGGDLGSAVVWRTDDLTEAYRVPMEKPPGVRALAFGGDMLLVGYDNGWFEAYADEGRTREGGGEVYRRGGVSSLAQNPKRSVVVMGSEVGSMRAIETAGEWSTVQLWRGEPPPPIAVNQIAFSPDGEHFVAACSDGAARLVRCYESNTGTLGAPFYLKSPKPAWDRTMIVSSACFDRARPLVYTAHFDGTVRVWGLPHGLPLLTVRLDGDGCGYVSPRGGRGGPASWHDVRR